MALCLKPLHDGPDLQAVQRTVTCDRTDDVAFAKPQAFGAALVTLWAWKRVAPNRLPLETGAAGGEVHVRAADGRDRAGAGRRREMNRRPLSSGRDGTSRKFTPRP